MTINVVYQKELHVDSYGVSLGLPQPNSIKHIANDRLAIAFAGTLPIRAVREKFLAYLDSKILAYYQSDMDGSVLVVTREEIRKFFADIEEFCVTAITRHHIFQLEFKSEKLPTATIDVADSDVTVARGNGGRYFLLGIILGRSPESLMSDIRLIEPTSGGTHTSYKMEDLKPYPTLKLGE